LAQALFAHSSCFAFKCSVEVSGSLGTHQVAR